MLWLLFFETFSSLEPHQLHNCSQGKKSSLSQKNTTFCFFKKMYKRLFKEESESPSTPTKKANTSQPRLVISSPNKGVYDNTTTTFVRDIRDPDDMSLLAVTFEGIYDLRMFFQGHSTILDDSGEQVKCPVTGFVAHHTKLLRN